MSEMESEMKTRVRGRGRDEERVTGNWAYAEFVHFTARPVEGIPDPHLHVHAFTFNLTRDQQEDRWKAGQFRDINREMPYYQAAFYARLASRIEGLGYPVARHGKNWDLAEIPRSLTARFSRRTKLAPSRRAGETKGSDEPGLESGIGGQIAREEKERLLDAGTAEHLACERLTKGERATLATLAGPEGFGFEGSAVARSGGRRNRPCGATLL